MPAGADNAGARCLKSRTASFRAAAGMAAGSTDRVCTMESGRPNPNAAAVAKAMPDAGWDARGRRDHVDPAVPC